MKENVATPDRIIAFVAPRGSLDYWSKVFLLILIIGLMNFIRDNIEHGSGADSLFANVIEAALIGLPFCLFSLYSTHSKTRRFCSEMMRKLSVT